ncbi:MAG: biotin--[acetyl-CoA-carboxylase] ligase [Dehalococcoidia bacterium]|nr:biotin--[acetyl-CoA-carboxylase] ligase [Dehalococcoidia bacterium]
MPFDTWAYDAQRTSRAVGAEVRFVEVATSTMDLARAGALAGVAPGTAYVAGEQTTGRGRQGRSWLSAASTGLYVTYHLRTSEAARAPLYSLAGALASSDAILTASGLATVLKWPNDVLAGPPGATRKLAGVLAESRPATTSTGAVIDVFLGIGINVRTAALPPEVAALATSIEGAGALPPTREGLLAALSGSLEGWCATLEADPPSLLEGWRQRLATLGQRVRLQTPSGPVEGEAVDVSPSGELVLRLDDGRAEVFAAGDVTTLRGPDTTIPQ